MTCPRHVVPQVQRPRGHVVVAAGVAKGGYLPLSPSISVPPRSCRPVEIRCESLPSMDERLGCGVGGERVRWLDDPRERAQPPLLSQPRRWRPAQPQLVALGRLGRLVAAAGPRGRGAVAAPRRLGRGDSTGKLLCTSREGSVGARPRSTLLHLNGILDFLLL